MINRVGPGLHHELNKAAGRDTVHEQHAVRPLRRSKEAPGWSGGHWSSDRPWLSRPVELIARSISTAPVRLHYQLAVTTARRTAMTRDFTGYGAGPPHAEWPGDQGRCPRLLEMTLF